MGANGHEGLRTGRGGDRHRAGRAGAGRARRRTGGPVVRAGTRSPRRFSCRLRVRIRRRGDRARHQPPHGARHREICLLRDPGDLLAAQQTTGWREALSRGEAAGRAFNLGGDHQGAFGDALDLLARSDRPRAVVCGSDEQALGVIAAARIRDLRIPAQLAVVGQGGVKEGGFSVPSLTTVTTDRDQMAAVALNALAFEMEIRAREPGAAPERAPALHPPPAPGLMAADSCGCTHAASTARSPAAAHAR
ncbi:substrate-binding domain-containing protein [Streptomyces sp. NPDC059063]|uniref:substrate-binding domain-containing protein n=1 Tax=unclassified Streptomyces TaxID=2593676 RepID=UPI003690C31E